MGDQHVKPESEPDQLRSFVMSLLKDVHALEYMLSNEMIESGVSRIGAEQELFIVDKNWRPAPKAPEILGKIDDVHFTSELALFNLEFNLDPLSFEGQCFRKMEQAITDLLSRGRTAAHQCDGEILMTGILPTIRKSDLGLNNMTPKPRYFALNEAVSRLRGGEYELYLRGTDELYLKHDCMMLESCNTSFQVHIQVDARTFPKFYNLAQALSGPALALAVNSPLLFGKRLWQETRIAVFEQVVDTRYPSSHLRHSTPRVSFGNGWVKQSVLELFQEDIARFRVLVGAEIDEDSFDVLAKGGIPFLKALQLHNSTVYRWNRPCYGITNGKPHLRIENRMFPSGPTPPDEVANAAFWLGAIKGMASLYEDITTVLDFDDAKTNFVAAARQGLKAQFVWTDNQTIPARDLVIQHLLPVAQEGLRQADIDTDDIDRYLGIIKERVSSGQTGAAWTLKSFAGMKFLGTVDQCLEGLTEGMSRNEQTRLPVHEWPQSSLASGVSRKHHFEIVEQYMTSDVLSVHEDAPIELVIDLMTWRSIRHLPVEDHEGRLAGLVTYRSLLELLRSRNDINHAQRPVSTIMQRDVPVVSPSTPSLEAVSLMRRMGATCLPVLHEERLVGIVTQNDFMRIAAHFLEANARENGS